MTELSIEYFSVTKKDTCSASNSKQGQLNITRNRPNSIVKPDVDDGGRSADVSKRDLVKNLNFSSYRESNQSLVNAISWNGPINHGNRSFKTSMKNVDVSLQFLLNCRNLTQINLGIFLG